MLISNPSHTLHQEVPRPGPQQCLWAELNTFPSQTSCPRRPAEWPYLGSAFSNLPPLSGQFLPEATILIKAPPQVENSLVAPKAHWAGESQCLRYSLYSITWPQLSFPAVTLIMPSWLNSWWNALCSSSVLAHTPWIAVSYAMQVSHCV